MAGIIGIVALLTILALSLLITRLAATALRITGLSADVARFQARSAFTGTGYTTSEAENVVDHPVRRRIIMILMAIRSAGLVTIVLSLILSFMGAGDVTRLVRLAWLIGGVIALWLVSLIPAVDHLVERLLTWALRRYTRLDVRDYVSLLDLSGNYAVRELHIREDDWLAGKTLDRCQLPDEGAVILGINRASGPYIGAPKLETEIHAGDKVILYGHVDTLEDLDIRRSGPSGDQAHQKAVGEQQGRLEEQERQERAHERSRREDSRESEG